MFPRLLQIQTGRKAEEIYPNDGRFANETQELMRNNENICVFFKSRKPRIEDQLEMLFDRRDDRDQAVPGFPWQEGKNARDRSKIPKMGDQQKKRKCLWQERHVK